jgi:hypothetical protein
MRAFSILIAVIAMLTVCSCGEIYDGSGDQAARAYQSNAGTSVHRAPPGVAEPDFSHPTSM